LHFNFDHYVRVQASFGIFLFLSGKFSGRECVYWARPGQGRYIVSKTVQD
jgi:hypothetical protein